MSVLVLGVGGNWIRYPEVEGEVQECRLDFTFDISYSISYSI